MSEVYITIRMTREEALKRGLLTCKNCGLPENNHFDWGMRPCAHDDKCKAYTEVARYGVLVEAQ